ncbi:MAG: helix-turn-helix transcriptional regulator [Ruminococcaceae bacterium]|nr:helix-turn-helix transcriptional regulator [Oscillospiraceae bacterium]
MEYAEMIKCRILELAKQNGISLNRLALMSGLQHSTISNIMCGASKNPSIKTIHRIANALCMTPAEFLDFPAMNDWEFED